MKRKMYEDLVKWKQKAERKPLLLMGARQVGKTYLLEEFARNEFEEVVYLNLDRDRERYEAVFEGSIDARAIMQKIEALVGKKLEAEKTMVIFDEVQEIPRALSALKYFCEDAPEYFVAASGSFLGVALHEGTSFPVGKVDVMELAPLTFEEFLMATGNERFLSMVNNAEELKIIEDKLEVLFREYLVVGGMPEAVASWVKERDYARVDVIQNTILLAYLNDISKHTDAKTAIRVRQIWNSLPAQFAKRNEKFMFNIVREGARAREYEMAIQWLVDCKVVRKVERVKTGNKVPLKAYVEPAAFKLYFLDVGLFRHLAGVRTELVVGNEKMFGEFNGFFVEQFVLQQLAGRHELFYWSSGASAEVDFVTETAAGVVPIEVKSGVNVKAKSLRIFREKYQPALSVRFSLRPVEYNAGLLNLPIFLAGMSEAYLAKYGKIRQNMPI